MGTITHAAERKAFEVALNAVVRKTEKGRRNGYVGVVNGSPGTSREASGVPCLNPR